LEDEVPNVVEGIEETVFIAVQFQFFLHARDICVLDVGRVKPFQEDFSY
jgi:hypothetical protein